ncbi:MAG: TIGR02996 domain-containing protein [Fimbriiglobus sp.]
MTDDEALRLAILADPEANLPRLVYADFLEEQGQTEYAEFIRIQCELAESPTDDARTKWLLTRDTELHGKLRQDARVVDPSLIGLVSFRRGFVEGLDVSAESLLRANPDWLRLQPIRALRLVNADRLITDIAALPLLRRVVRLILNNNNFGLANRLTQLDRADMPELRELSFRNNRLWPDAIGMIGDMRIAPQLKHLDLSGNPIGDEGVDGLAQHPAFVGLEELVLRNDEIDYSGSIHAAGARSIAESWTLSSLKLLNLADQYIGDSGFVALTDSSNSDRLVSLDVSYNEIGIAGDAAFSRSDWGRHFGSLRELNLSGNVLDHLAVQGIVSSRLPKLQTLDLRFCLNSTERIPEILRSMPSVRVFHDPIPGAPDVSVTPADHPPS